MTQPRIAGLNRHQRRALDKVNRRAAGKGNRVLIDIPEPAPGEMRDAARAIMRDEAEKALRALESVVQDKVTEILHGAIKGATDALNAGPNLLADAGRTINLDALGAIPTEWRSRLPDVIDTLAAAYGAGAWATATRLAASKAVTPAVNQALDRRAVGHLADAGNRMVGVGDDAWSTIRGSLEKSFKAGSSFDQMSTDLSKAADLAERRAMTVARTETIRAVNAGQYDTATILDVSAQKQWLATLDASTRPDHADADGQAVPLADPFDVGGESLDYPGDPNGSAEQTVNCRCTLLFVDTAGETDETNRGMPLDESDLTPEEQALQDEALAASGQETTMTHRISMGADSITVTLDDGETIDPRALGASVATAVMNRVTQPRSFQADAVIDLAEIAPDLATEVIETPLDARPDTPAKAGEVMPDAPPETWHAVLVVEGKPTGDRRLIEQGALTWRDLPLPMMNQVVQPEGGGHAGSVDVARMTRVERQGAEIHSWGYHLSARAPGDDEPTAGEQWFATLCEVGKMGVSVDMDDADVEVDWPEPDPEGDPMEQMFAEPDLVRFTRARLMGATCVPFPAFSEAYIEPVQAEPDTIVTPAASGPADPNAIIAAAAPVAPPLAWFDRPAFTAATPHTVTDDGRTFGHLAAWGTCHTSFQGACITPPVEDEAAFFTTGEIVTEEGERVAVGRLTLGTGHAKPGLMSADAVAHYDNTGTAVADVAVGFDEFGIWYAGALRPHLTAETVRTFRGSALSGDWRRIGGQLRLVAALGVNTPGFPIPRTQSSVRDGVQISLAAAGVLPPAHENVASGGRANRDAIVERVAASIGRSKADRLAALSARVHGIVLTEFGCNCGGNTAKAVPMGAKMLAKSDDLRASARPVVTYDVVTPNGKTNVDTLMEARRLAKSNGGTIRIR